MRFVLVLVTPFAPSSGRAMHGRVSKGASGSSFDIVRRKTSNLLRTNGFLLFAAVTALLVAAPARALEVFACEPEWGALAAVLGGDKVSVTNATTGRQDPHRIQARPALIARLRKADLAVCTGAELEIGWMPLLLRQSANPRVQPGRPGWFAAADHVTLKDIPGRLDRSEGDIHAAGNPHIQTDPRNIARIAEALTRRLTEIDSANAAEYQRLGAAFQARWGDAIRRWEAEATPLRGQSVVVYHRSWRYLFDWLGLVEAGAVEPKPGVPPSSAHLAQLLAEIPPRRARAVIYAAYQDARAAEFVAGRAGIPAIELPFTVGGNDAAQDLYSLFDDTIRRLTAGIAAAP